MNSFLRKLGWFARRHERDVALQEELDFHLAEETEERRAAGLTEEQARSAARRDLGNLTLVVEDTRAVWASVVLEQLAQDLRYAARTLSRSPSVTVTAVATMAVGIGLTTALFSVVHGILLRPLPFEEPNRLVVLDTLLADGRSDGGLSPPNFMSLHAEKTRAFESMGAVLQSDVTLTGVGEARKVAGASVSAELFDVLAVRPSLGRVFHREENAPGAERVVVLAHALWQGQFGSDPDLIGRRIVLDGTPHTVIGIMPTGFGFPGGRQLWVPLPHGRNYFSADSTAGRKSNAYVRVLARLRPGVTVQASQAELGAMGRRLQERFPSTNVGVSFTARPLHDQLVGDVRGPLLMLLGAVGCVLFIGTANVAGLLLARAASRRDEIAVRGALGAGRARIVRQLVTESMLLGLGGGVLGLLLALWATDQIVALQLSGLQRLDLVDSVRLDGTVLLFAAGITLAAGIAAGVLPAFRAADDGLAAGLQRAGRNRLGSPGGRRLRSVLVVGQLSVAVLLLYGAGLLGRSFVRLTSVDPGFRTEQALSFRVDLPAAAYRDGERVRWFFDSLFERIKRHTGVLSVGAIHRLPIASGGGFRSRFRVEGHTPEGEPSIGVRIVTPEYFRAMGVPVLRGRGIEVHDRAGGLAVVVINETAAAQFFPGQDPIGKRLVAFTYDPLEKASDAFTVTGIVADVRSRGLTEAPQPEAYFALGQVPHRQMFVVVRTGGDPLAHVATLRTEMKAVDADLPSPEFRTLEDVVGNAVQRPRFFAVLLSLFSAVALALAAVGVFSLLSFAVAQRRREIGIRVALGASPHAVVGTIAGEAVRLVALGLVIGLGAGLAAARLLETQLFGINRVDPVTVAAIVLALAATALAASLVPAWRASTIDPLLVLRAD